MRIPYDARRLSCVLCVVVVRVVVDHSPLPQVDPHAAGKALRVPILAPLVEKRRVKADFEHFVGMEREQTDPAVAVVRFFPLEVKEQLVHPLAAVRSGDAERNRGHLGRHMPADHEQAIRVPPDQLFPDVRGGVDGGLRVLRDRVRPRA